jgi:hypothetical protein
LGSIDEFSVYNRPLSAAEIQAIYSAGSFGKCLAMPSIVLPPSSQTVQCSSNATFQVIATGMPPLAYQWCFGSTLLPGATNTALVLTNAGFAQTGAYSIIVTNAYGSVTSGPAMLTVIDTIAPTIWNCASNLTLSAGANCTVGLPDLTGQVVATDASGAVTVTQTPPAGTPLELGMTSITFTALDSSSNASTCVSSVTVVDTTPPLIVERPFSLTVNFNTNCLALLPDITGTNFILAIDNCSSVTVAQTPAPLTPLSIGTNTVWVTASDSASNHTTVEVSVIVPQLSIVNFWPTNADVGLGGNITLGVTACGLAPIAYQWQCGGTNLSWGTNALLSLTNVALLDAGQYRVVVTNAGGSITSAVAVVSVLGPPAILAQPKSLMAVPGGTVTFSVVANGWMPLSYQWYKDDEDLAGETNATLTLTGIELEDFADYTVDVTNSVGSILSKIARLSMAALPVIGSPTLSGGTFKLVFPTETGPSYVVEYKDSLNDSVWKQLITVDGTNQPVTITDSSLTNASRFYRVRVR